jgi:hypothetical protein
LELILVLLSQRGGFVGRDGLADGDDLDLVAVSVAQPILDERGGQLGDVDADPLAAQLLGGVNRRAAAAEWVKDEIAGIAAGAEDALKKDDGFLCGVAEAFRSRRGKGRNVRPNILERRSTALVQVFL